MAQIVEDETERTEVVEEKDIGDKETDAIVHSKEEAVALKEQGNVAFKAKEWDAARKSYMDALYICPLDETVERSKLLSNIAACDLEQEEWEDCVKTCTEALELDSEFLRPRIRRAKANMKLDNSASMSSALEDWQEVLKREAGNKEAREWVVRLPSRIQEVQEREKKEMMDKLKTLGNQFLGAFGMSLDQFNVKPSASGGKEGGGGGYSVSFNS
ncbi:hypothetical protein BC829DRAFT_435912 [Chytridium lagenaria]|nr:hypothetical protein BC829DRAFT_435912 [Chytridium lagenaria]